MKKIIICLILIVHSLTFTQSLRVKEGIVNDEVIINTFKTSAFPNGITLVPMEKDRKWEHPINTTEEYFNIINYLAIALTYTEAFYNYEYSASRRVTELRKILNAHGETVKGDLLKVKDILEKTNYKVRFIEERKGALEITTIPFVDYRILIPFRIFEGNQITFLYDSANVNIKGISKIWLADFFLLTDEYEKTVEEKLKIYNELYETNKN